MFMRKKHAQLVNSFSIIVGGILLLFEISKDDKNVYILIPGLILLMFGLYRATNHWAETKDDHKEAPEDQAEKNS